MPDHRKKKGSKAQKQSEAQKQYETQEQCDNQPQHNGQMQLYTAALDFIQPGSALVEEPQPTPVNESRRPARPEKKENKTKETNGSPYQPPSTASVQSVFQLNGTYRSSPTEEAEAELSEQSGFEDENDDASASDAPCRPPSGRSGSSQVSSGSGRRSSHGHASAPGRLHFPDKHDKTIVCACHAPWNHGNHSRPVRNSAISWAAIEHMLNTRNRWCTKSQWRVILEQNDMGYMIGDRGQIPCPAPPAQECHTDGQGPVQTSSTNDRGLSGRVHYTEARSKAVLCDCQTPYSHANAEAVSLAIECVALRIMRQTGRDTCSKDEFDAYSRRENQDARDLIPGNNNQRASKSTPFKAYRRT
jgi:hypothetical protein